MNRQSLFPSEAPSSYWSNLRACSEAIGNATESLEAASAAIGDGIYDYPRMTKILGASNTYEVVTESELLSASAALSAEIKPHMDELLGRIKGSIEDLSKREANLRDKTAARSRPNKPISNATSQSNISSLEKKLKTLQNRKEMLSSSAEKLENEIDELRNELQ